MFFREIQYAYIVYPSSAKFNKLNSTAELSIFTHFFKIETELTSLSGGVIGSPRDSLKYYILGDANDRLETIP